MTYKLKLLKKVDKSPEMRIARELDRGGDGSVIINVGLKSYEEIFSPYSYLTYEMISDEVTNYLGMCEESLPPSCPLSIDIYTETATSGEQKRRIRQSIKRYYAEKLVRLKRQQKKNILLGGGYIIIGIILLLLESFYYDFFNGFHSVFLVEVSGWVFLWDGLETIMGEWSTIGQQKRQCYHILAAKIHVRSYSQKIKREYKVGEFEE